MKKKRKSEKARGERREIDTGCQGMSKVDMYKKYFSLIITGYPDFSIIIATPKS